MIEEPVPSPEELNPFIELAEMLPELCPALRMIEKVVPILAKATHRQQGEESVYIDDCIRSAIGELGRALRAGTERTMHDRLMTAGMCIHLVEHWDSIGSATNLGMDPR